MKNLSSFSFYHTFLNNASVFPVGLTLLAPCDTIA
jgi:hypothetical protein